MVLGYWVECRKSTESTWKKCNKQRLKETEFAIAGLAEATEYEFRVFAENETGLSRPRRTAACIKTKLSGTYIGTCVFGSQSHLSLALCGSNDFNRCDSVTFIVFVQLNVNPA